MLGFEVQNLPESLHPIGPLCGNGSRSKIGQVQTLSEMLGFKVQNLTESLHLIEPLCGNGSHSKVGQVHPYQGCLG